jgi:hypothetical protein
MRASVSSYTGVRSELEAKRAFPTRFCPSLSTLAFTPVNGLKASAAKVVLDGQVIPADMQQEAGRYLLIFATRLQLQAGQSIQITFV